MIRTGYFSIIRVPDVTDTLQIQAILLVVNANAHIIVNRLALLQNIESLDMSYSIEAMKNDPCDYIAVSLFDLLSTRTLLEIIKELH